MVTEKDFSKVFTEYNSLPDGEIPYNIHTYLFLLGLTCQEHMLEYFNNKFLTDKFNSVIIVTKKLNDLLADDGSLYIRIFVSMSYLNQNLNLDPFIFC